jgi:serine protease Do
MDKEKDFLEFPENQEMIEGQLNLEEHFMKNITSEDDTPKDNEHSFMEDPIRKLGNSNKTHRKMKMVPFTIALVLFVHLLFGGIIYYGLRVFRPELYAILKGDGVLLNNRDFGDGPVRDIIVETTDSPVVAVASKVGPSVVGIRVTARLGNSWLYGTIESTPEGSGIIVRQDGYIITNDHVIASALSPRTNELAQGSKIEVILPQELDKPYEATVVGRDTRTDLAVLKINARNLPVIDFGDSDNLKVGELVVAIGNPGGLEYMGSVTVGYISGLNRTIPVEDGKELKLIQTDAAINPGNSGGALVNTKGQLIGVNAAKIGGSAFEGLGFAIPVNVISEVSDSLINYQYVRGRPLLGILVNPSYNESVARQNNMPVGVLVSEVSPFSGADLAGIRPRDIITKFNKEPVKNVQELNGIRDKFQPGDVIDAEIYRGGQYLNLQVTLSEDRG